MPMKYIDYMQTQLRDSLIGLRLFGNWFEIRHIYGNFVDAFDV